ncbi:hypothetical protein BpHYR1_049249 [Brachionus plicatilis]|uniref:Uncharacterized protein n=1 Tax=Brachionus plicatilis TaxID=10195 RepID=A0A3M7QMU8_BRAPC|nr:hypothetical protein BpHYR1_049249 [Brachionus plicatilis]
MIFFRIRKNRADQFHDQPVLFFIEKKRHSFYRPLTLQFFEHNKIFYLFLKTNLLNSKKLALT